VIYPQGDYQPQLGTIASLRHAPWTVKVLALLVAVDLLLVLASIPLIAYLAAWGRSGGAGGSSSSATEIAYTMVIVAGCMQLIFLKGLANRSPAFWWGYVALGVLLLLWCLPSDHWRNPGAPGAMFVLAHLVMAGAPPTRQWCRVSRTATAA
jgi:hypothetical protein